MVGPYQLLEPLGAGGMGEVWKARDRLLNRVVALKFISTQPREAAPAGDLLHEARAASALNHPNIVTIFQIGESEGATFLAMEFVEGASLRERLRRERIALADALDWMRQIVDGLASAHEHGIVHRDLKPENIMLRIDGRVKLVDFGLAKVLPWEDVTTGDRVMQTSDSGHLVGTFNYMSPEQARGRSISAASDVFSLGIVMYELLTGEHPFHGETVLDTLNAIIREQPVPVTTKCPTAPAGITAVVAKALQKEVSARYASATELRRQLEDALSHRTGPPVRVQPAGTRLPSARMRALGVALLLLIAGATGWNLFGARDADPLMTPPVHALAVMPLRAQSNDTRAAMLAEDLPEDLGGALATAGFRVASRSSVEELGAGATARAVGEQLGVDAVLEGTVRTAGGGLRVYVELVSVRTRFQIWSGTFTTSGEEMIGSDPRMAAEIADRVRTALAAR